MVQKVLPSRTMVEFDVVEMLHFSSFINAIALFFKASRLNAGVWELAQKGLAEGC